MIIVGLLLGWAGGLATMAAGPSTPLLNGGFNEGPGNLRGWTVSDAALVTVNASHQVVLRESEVDNEVTLSQAFLLPPGAETLFFTLNGFTADSVVEFGHTPDAFGVALVNPTNALPMVPTIDATTDSFFIQDIVPTGSTGELASGVTVAAGPTTGSFRIGVDVTTRAGQGVRLIFRLLGGSDGSQTNGAVILSDVVVEGSGLTFPPVANAGPDRVAGEGAAVALLGTFTETVPVSGQAFLWRVVSTNGAVVFEAESQNANFVPPDDGVFTATFTVSDANGSGSDSADITITNVPPSLSLSGPSEITQGVTYTLNFGAIDPGADAIREWVVDWGDGNVETIPGHPTTATHTYAVAPATRTISAQATDEDGTYDAANTVVVTVKEAASTAIVLSGAAEVNEGTAYVLTLAANDPAADASTLWAIAWGDGSTSTVTGRTATATHVYVDGPTNLTVSASATYSAVVHPADNTVAVGVRNVSPVLTLAGPAEVTAGIPYTLQMQAVDPGTDTLRQWVIRWGDGITDTLSGNPATASHTYAIGPATRTITAQASDEDGTYDAGNAVVVNVKEGSPTSIVLSGAAEVEEGGPYVLNLVANHPSADASTQWTIQWGDGTTSTATGRAPTASHRYVDGPTNVTISAEATFGATSHPADNSVAVTVRNLPPVLTLGGSSEVDQGVPYTLFLAATDSGADTIQRWVISWGDGVIDTVLGNPVQAVHTYTSAPANVSITAQASDEDGTYDAKNAVAIRVQESTAFTIRLAGAAVVDEGANYTLSLATTDPTADASTVWTVFWGDGTIQDVTGASPTATHAYGDGPAVFSISAMVTLRGVTRPSDNSISVEVANVAPSQGVSGPSEVDEGSVYRLNLGSVRDGGQDTVTEWIVHWGDGSENRVTTLGELTHLYADGPATFDVTVDVRDEDGLHSGVGRQSVKVLNVAPTVELSGPATVDNGAEYRLEIGAPSDPGTDTVRAWLVRWGDGSEEVLASGGPVTHLYTNGPQVVEILVDLEDEDGRHPGAGRRTVEVFGDALVVDIDGPSLVSEGAEYSLALSASQPDLVREWTIDWGDGGTTTVVGNATTATHRYPDGPAQHTITARFTRAGDSVSLQVPSSVELAVKNVSPRIPVLGARHADEGSAYTVRLGAVEDPGTDTVTEFIVHWGDGTTERFSQAGEFEHTYADGPMERTIMVDLVDEDGTSYDADVNAGSGNIELRREGRDFVLYWGGWGVLQEVDDLGRPFRDVATGRGPFTLEASGTDKYYRVLRSLAVLVRNVAPRIELIGEREVDEGSEYRLELGPITDPGLDRVTGFIVHWGDGSTNRYASPGVVTHLYADGPTNRTVTVDLIDEDGEYADADIKGNATGLRLERRGGDLAAVWNGWGILQEATEAAGVFLDLVHGTAPKLLASGRSRGFYQLLRSHAVHVRNVAPRIPMLGNRTVQAGAIYRLLLVNPTDPGQDTVHDYIVRWGDGTIDHYAAPGVVTHVFASGSGLRLVEVDLVDEDGFFGDANSLGEPKQLQMVRGASGLQVEWNNEGLLEFSDAVEGPYRPLGGANSPYVVSGTEARRFYRGLRAHPVWVTEPGRP